jgi:hypothetical protein
MSVHVATTAVRYGGVRAIGGVSGVGGWDVGLAACGVGGVAAAVDVGGVGGACDRGDVGLLSIVLAAADGAGNGGGVGDAAPLLLTGADP